MQRWHSENKGEAFCTNTLLFLIVSFLGWAGETVYALVATGQLCDRGFLTLPFCPIYGFSVLLIYALLGTPQAGGWILRGVKKPLWRLSFYVFFSILIPTVAELITGWFFHRTFGILLWDYSSKPLNLGGYICLEFSLAWGVMIPLGMGLLFPRLRRWVKALPRKLAFLLSVGFSVLLCADLVLAWLLR